MNIQVIPASQNIPIIRHTKLFVIDFADSFLVQVLALYENLNIPLIIRVKIDSKAWMVQIPLNVLIVIKVFWRLYLDSDTLAALSTTL